MRMSKFEKLGKEQLQKLVNESNNMLDLITKCGLSPKGTGNYITLKKVFAKLNIDYQILLDRKNSAHGKRLALNRKIPLEAILVENCLYASNSDLKRRAIEAGILEEKCYECNLPNIWNNKKLILQLDHINGKNKDNRKENLRLLCPNCHSQTKTFGSKNLNKLAL